MAGLAVLQTAQHTPVQYHALYRLNAANSHIAKTGLKSLSDISSTALSSVAPYDLCTVMVYVTVNGNYVCK